MTSPVTRIDKDTFGPWAIVTGASSGIGKEFARQLAASPRDAQRVCSVKSNGRESVLAGSHVCPRHREPCLTPNRGKAELSGWGQRCGRLPTRGVLPQVGVGGWRPGPHCAVHGAFMALPPYTGIRQGEVPELGPGVRDGSHRAPFDPCQTQARAVNGPVKPLQPK